MAKVLFYKPYKAVVRNACQSRTIFARWFLRVGKRILAVVHNDSTKKLTTGLFWNIYIYICICRTSRTIKVPDKFRKNGKICPRSKYPVKEGNIKYKGQS